MLEERAQHCLGGRWQLHFAKRTVHERDPTVAGALIHREGCMTHAQARMAALLNVAWRASKTENEEIPKPLFRAFQVVRGIHRPQNIVARNLPVERGNETPESLLSDFFKHVIFRELIWHPSIVANRG